jgi:fructose-bisphosphate aldolase class II
MVPDSPFANLNVMIHLDHILWDEDQELLSWDMGQFSSIMFDASDLPIDVNIQKTAEFVKLNKDNIIIEGACAEIGESFSDSPIDLTSPDMAEKYYVETGVDILVANLGTEHRASSTNLQYQDQLARDITNKIGPRLCLHGTSSISIEKLSGLFDDGICKVNIWTTLERDTTPALVNNILENISKMVGREKVNAWVNTHILGEMIDQSSTPSVDYFTTTYRQNIIFNRMKEIVLSYLNLWYK